MNKIEKEKERKEQLKCEEQNVIKELTDETENMPLKDFYKKHFDEIKEYIRETNSRLAIEDIVNLAKKNEFDISSYPFLFRKQINDAIANGSLTKNML